MRARPCAPADPPERFHAPVPERLAALARVQGLLSRADVAPISIGDILRIEIEALGSGIDDNRVSQSGPKVLLRSSVVQTLALALHDLATNARKYGALSNGTGRLGVTWDRTTDAEGAPWLSVARVETGIVAGEQSVPRGTGYGRMLLERALPHPIGARTSYRLGETELRCTVEIPLKRNGQKD